MKESFYFSHDYSARNDDKILELRSEFGMEGYGVFWAMLETMAENADNCIRRELIGGLSLSYGVPRDRVEAILRKCIELGIFTEGEKGIYSLRMVTHKERRKALSDAGYEGAKKRWGDGVAIATPMQRKGKERKGNNNSISNELDISGSQAIAETVKKDVRNPEIEKVVSIVKEEVEKAGKLYSKGKKERIYARNMLVGVDFGNAARTAGFHSRGEFAKAIINLSAQTKYAKDIFNCETLYLNYASVFNVGKKEYHARKPSIETSF